ncbi:B-cell receptor CD22-like isoform X2 [Dendropsophus ebraccatus]|uniref:B-cell receptor CD22-like isoform X2 n=1 Tax=Dendropsophus ebraccatus TaxID=150705 RepID=UPI0038312720
MRRQFTLKGSFLLLLTLGCSDNITFKDWEFKFPHSIEALKGSCVEIPCELQYPDNAQNLTFFWYKKAFIGKPIRFNNKTSTNVEERYKGRTFLVGNSLKNCSLRINNVQEREEIYPGISEEITSYNVHKERFCRVYVIDSPPAPVMEGAEQMIENETVHITCSINHTCASSPPSITWNKPDLETTTKHEDLGKGIWRLHSTITYIPSYKDNRTQLECTVTFPNNKTSRRSVTLDITYTPKNVTILVVENDHRDGGDITLLCTSQANPPVTAYTWYKGGRTKTRTGSGIQITVRNETSETYICSARNNLGIGNSSEFSFITHNAAKSEEHNNILIIGGTAGFMALAIMALAVTVCIFKRKQRTSVPIQKKKTLENVKKSEQITMDHLLYENFNGAPGQHSTGARNSRNSPLGPNHEEEKNGFQNEENETSIVYASVELPPANHIARTSRITEETEYVQLMI